MLFHARTQHNINRLPPHPIPSIMTSETRIRASQILCILPMTVQNYAILPMAVSFRVRTTNGPQLYATYAATCCPLTSSGQNLYVPLKCLCHSAESLAELEEVLWKQIHKERRSARLSAPQNVRECSNIMRQFKYRSVDFGSFLAHLCESVIDY